MKKYIDEGYIIVTTEPVERKIKEICPNARVCSLSPKTKFVRDEWGINKYLVDKYYTCSGFVVNLKNDPGSIVVEWSFTNKEIEKLRKESEGYRICAPMCFSGVKSINEFEHAFNTVKKAVEENQLDLTDIEINSLLFCLTKENLISDR